MNNDLPGVYANRIDKKLNNTQELYYADGHKEERHDSRSVDKKIHDIFNSANYVYKSNVRITLNNKTVNKTIVGKNNNYLLTMDNDSINISDILDIEVI